MAAALLLSAASQSFSLYDAVSAAVNASTSAADFPQPRNAGPNEAFSTPPVARAQPSHAAVSPDFYAALRPLVAEALPFLPFPLLGPALDVDIQLRQAVRRAFDEWEANTPALRFVDVSDARAAERLWVPIDELRCIASPACALLHGGDSATPLWGGPSPVCRDPIQFNRTCSATDKNGILDPSLQTTVERDPTYAADVTMCASAACFDCERADIVVGAFVQANRLLGDHTGGRVLREGRSGQVPLGTNGRAQAGGSLTRARLEAQRRPEGREVLRRPLRRQLLAGRRRPVRVGGLAPGRRHRRHRDGALRRAVRAAAVRLLLRVPPARAEARLQFAAGLGPRPRRQGRDPRDDVRVV